MKFPRIGIYSSLGYDGSPLLGFSDRIASIAKWDDIIMDLSAIAAHPEILSAIRKNNPSVLFHGYIVMKAYPWAGEFYTTLNNLVASMDGYLYDTDGNMWRDSNINITKSNLVKALANLFANYSSKCDSLFLDVFCPQMTNAVASGVDIKKAGYTVEKEFQDAWAKGHATLVDMLKMFTSHKYVITGNCGPWSHANVNGWMRENFPYQGNGPGDKPWEANMLENSFKQPGLMLERYVLPNHSWLISEPSGYDPMNAENLRKHRYGLASACLGNAFHSFARKEGDTTWGVERLKFWYPEYQHSILGKYWLGEPVNNAYKISTNLWARNFKNGIVVVNPNPTSHYINLGTGFRYTSGVLVVGVIDIPPNDAVLLEKVK